MIGYSLLLVSILVLLMQWSIGKGMVEYVLSKEVETLKPVITKLSNTYKIENNWLSMTNNHQKFQKLIAQQLDSSDFKPPQRKGRPEKRLFSKPNFFPPDLAESRPPPHNRRLGARPPPPPIESEAHYALLDIDDSIIVGSYLEILDYVKTPIKVNNHVVGYFAISKRSQITQGYEVDFIEQQQHYLWLIAILVMIIVVLVTLPLARHVVEPIKLITSGMHKLTQGNYQQSIHLKRQDELAELSRDYNELALTLAENESARKRWLANISHELRTPVAILRGELEAMLDNVRPLTSSNISSANDEVKHLQRLIDDLNLLSSADVGGMRYRKKNEDLIALMNSESDKYTGYLADGGITLNIFFNNNNMIQNTLFFDINQNISYQGINIYIDKSRLLQLFENIITNCIKYSAATELKISISLDDLNDESIEDDQRYVSIIFEDDGVGVEDSHFSHLFEHLYRVEDSRNRKTGGSGLGLSICHHIVVAHQGKIKAKKSSLGGLAILVYLPLTLT